MTSTKEGEAGLTRAQNRLLRRIYNGRSVPILLDGKQFLTYKDASHYLRSLPAELCEVAYQEMKAQAKRPRLKAERQDLESQ